MVFNISITNLSINQTHMTYSDKFVLQFLYFVLIALELRRLGR